MGLQALLAASAATQAAGSISGGFAASQAGRFNARLAEQEAEQARIQAGMEAARIGQEGRAVRGAQAAAAAKSGVDVTQGSPLLVMLDTLRKSTEDVSLARYKGELRATALRSEAVLQRRQARQALIGGILGATGAVTKGAAQYELAKQGKLKVTG